MSTVAPLPATGDPTAGRRIVIISGIRVRHDAISNIICQQRRTLADAGYEVSVLVHHHHDDGYPWEATVATSWELLRHPAYLEADLVIFHFGIYYELFNALALDHPRHARRVVHFHNVTPPELLHGRTQRSAQDGLIQLAIAERADVIWSDSLHNTDVMCDYTEIDRDAVVAMAPSVPDVRERPHDDSPHDGPVRLIAVGRFVEAKGLSILVAALASLPPEVLSGLRLTLAGSIASSDDAYLHQLGKEIAAADLADHIDIVPDPPDEELIDLLWRADVFVSSSLHEGFCVPAIEALAAGCRAIVTDAGALPDTVGGCGVVVPVNDAAALAAAIEREVDVIRRQRAGEPQARADATAWRERVGAHLEQFTPRAAEQRLLDATAEILTR